MAYYLAIDIGASSGRHILATVNNDKLELEEIYRFENNYINTDDGLCWDIDSLRREVLAGIRHAGELGKAPQTIAMDTWGCDYVLLNENKEILHPVYSYRDPRTAEVQSVTEERMSFDEIYKRTGIQKLNFNTVYQLFCDVVSGRIEDARHFLMIPDYLAYVLTGNMVNEYTNATTTSMVNAETHEWDWDIIEAFDIPKDIFKTICKPGTKVGNLSKEIREYTGFDAEVILAPSHDTASAVAACPLNSDSAYISSGTWSLMGAELKAPLITDASRTYNFTNEGGVEYNFRYLKNIMGTWLFQNIRRELDKNYSFPDLIEMARSTDKYTVFNVNDELLVAPKSMLNAIKIMMQDQSASLPEVLNSAYHSLGKAYADTIREIEETTGKTIRNIIIIGGGSQDEYLNYITAMYTGKHVYTGLKEATATGNIMAQMMYLDGIDLKQAREIIKHTFPLKEVNMTSYERAKSTYETHFGVDVEAALDKLAQVPVSLHCWQGDDVRGFDTDPNKPLTGGIQTTGNYPGRARTPEELMADIDKVIALVPGKVKLNLHASYAIFDDDNGGWVDRDKLEPKHFAKWVKFCKERGLGCDFNPTFFSHPMCDPLTLASPNEDTRRFWIDHGKACIRISQYLAEELGQPCVMNIWTGDGFKDIPGDRKGPRARYRDSIDQILSEPYDFNLVKPCIESKVFGIGVESYTVGSGEFSLLYAAANKDRCIPLMDNGHYHPTEVVSDKISSLLAFFPEIALHVTRPVRWDSDHVLLFDDETREIAREIVRCGGLNGSVNIALDYFDASINRISAWITGFRNMEKALLYALLQPNDELKKLQDENNFTDLMVIQEELKTAPFGEIWNEYLRREGVEADYLNEVHAYEKEILEVRK